MRQRARVDRNHAEIVAALRAVGAVVQSLAPVGRGCPDLLVGYRGVNHLLEVKADHGRLTPDELVWLRDWDGRAAIVGSVASALEAIGVSVVVRERHNPSPTEAR